MTDMEIKVFLEEADVKKNFISDHTENKLICPFCKEEIISDLCLMFNKKDKDYTNGRQIYKCNKCGLFGNKKLVQELIRTRKALDKAKWWLNEIVENHRFTPISTAEKALKEITALEQKDMK